MKKAIGSAKARKQVKQITKRVLAHVKGLTPTESAHILCLGLDDVRNMKQGNKFSVPMLCKMVIDGHFDPTSILEGPELKKLHRARKTHKQKPNSDSCTKTHDLSPSIVSPKHME